MGTSASRPRDSLPSKFKRLSSQLTMTTLTTKAVDHSYPGFEKEKESSWQGPFYFIQGADPQFGMFDTYFHYSPEPGSEREIQLSKKCIEAIHAMDPKPRFFIVCGDLADAKPGSRYRAAQEEDFIKVFKELHPDIPLICVCGNHDVGNHPTTDSIQSYREKFGDDYFTFYCSGVMCIVVNSQYFEDSSLVQRLSKTQESWLDRQLEEAKSGKYKHVIVFQHLPWFLREPEENNQATFILPKLRRKMLKKFHDANVRAIFCGHIHRNAGGFYRDLEVVVSSAIGCQLGTDKSGFRVVKVYENSIQHKYYAFADTPKSITFD